MKKRRGRPRLMSPELAQWWRATYCRIHTDRQLQNRYLATEALGRLGLLPASGGAPSWLVDWTGAGKGRPVRWVVLEQLGRLSRAGLDDASLRSLAADACSWGVSAKAAATRLRVERLVWVRSNRSDRHARQKTETDSAAPAAGHLPA
jgi:hypothetical protein